MSEYMEKFSVSRLIGAPPGYVGYEDSGTVTKAARRKPYSVVLLDEVEKAHPDVFNILLQVLDEGHLTDNYGRVIDFKNTVVIMTSNVGARDMVKGKALGFAQPDSRASFEKMAEKVKEEINKTFNPEFLNRLDDIIVFHPLTREHIAQIVAILLKEVQRRLGEEELTLRLTPAASDFLVDHGYDEHFGARPLKRAIQKYVEDPLSEKILVGEFVIVRVRERPILVKWAVRGVSRLSEGSVRDKAQLAEGRPLDPAALARGRGRIDSLYRAEGYYLAHVSVIKVYEADSSRVRVVFDVDEGRRVAVARVALEGNTHLPTDRLVGSMKTRPEGFWWFRSGEYDDEKLRSDLQENLPKLYGDRGFVDFQVLGDTLLVDDSTGKATLVVRVSEGEPYRVGTFEIVGNRRFSTDELQQIFPFKEAGRTGFLGFGGAQQAPLYFDQEKWNAATQRLQTLYQ